MSFKFKKKLPVPKEIKELYPVSSALAAKKKELDQQIIDVITGKSDKFLAIIGPCSAGNGDIRHSCGTGIVGADDYGGHVWR